MANTSVHGFVSGKVQGVWFRGFTQQHALVAGVNGWAKNLSDGRVEFLLCGEQEDVEDVLEAIKKGPPASSVTELEVNTVEWQPIEGFTTS